MKELPCLAGKCEADNARARLASGEDIGEVERADLELAAHGCTGPQKDPWAPKLKWDGCPAKAALARADIRAGLDLRGLASMAPLAGWPAAYAGRPVETWISVAAARAELDAEAAR